MDDLELLSQWAEGSRAAGGLLIERHGAALSRFFATKVPEAAEDLTQATLLALLENVERLRQTHSFRGYMFGVARNLLFQHFRAARVRRGGLRYNTTSVLDRGPSPSTLLARSDEDVNLMRALSTLPMTLRILLELSYWEGLPAAELADVFGVAENTVHSRLHRAKRQLRVALAQLEAQHGPDVLD